MAANKKLLVLPGDGIGVEVMAATEKVLGWFEKQRALRFDIDTGLVGGAAIDAEGVPISDDTMKKAAEADAVLFGAVGGPKWDSLPFNMKPERGLLRLRKDLGLFANLRPALCFDALAEASTLKHEYVAGLDILIVRELTGGVYFGEPRGVETLKDGTKRAVDTQVYTTLEIERIARVGFELARKRNNKLHSVEKANVMHTGVLWRETVTRLHAAEYKDVELQHMYADNCAMQLVRNPKQFDVIVTDNLPSASLGAVDPKTGKRNALYEPIHGSAPDIAGKGVANPIATLMSFAMALRYSFDLPGEADLLEKAVAKVLGQGLRTGDIMQPGKTKVGTKEMSEAVLKSLDAAAA